MILGPLAEQQFRCALAISQGDLSTFITSPISAAVLLIAALAVIVPLIWRRFSKKSQPEQAAPAR